MGDTYVCDLIKFPGKNRINYNKTRNLCDLQMTKNNN